jgi:hypothetical protein
VLVTLISPIPLLGFIAVYRCPSLADFLFFFLADPSNQSEIHGRSATTHLFHSDPRSTKISDRLDREPTTHQKQKHFLPAMNGDTE